jgi:hypothetical protein
MNERGPYLCGKKSAEKEAANFVYNRLAYICRRATCWRDNLMDKTIYHKFGFKI